MNKNEQERPSSEKSNHKTTNDSPKHRKSIFKLEGNELESIIHDLKSSSHELRDRACIRFIDFVAEVKSTLITQIHNPHNENNRGTMVYALGFICCDDLFLEILKALLHSGYEVASGAYSILCQQHFEIKKEELESIDSQFYEYFLNQDNSDFASERIGMIRSVIEIHLLDDFFGGKFQKYIDKCDFMLA